MAKILADKDISRLLGTVIVGSTSDRINPNGIELCLGKYVHFLSTGEELELQPAMYLKVSPGETVSIASLETLDLRAETIHMTFPVQMLMGLITPTTTMMREGISQVSTKVDAGFHGMLNWSLRNGSAKDLILRYGEPIFKLTFLLLDKDESPEVPYGGRTNDSYQDTSGIARSMRKIPVDIPKSKLVASSFHKLDPKVQLREAGYPFAHIGTELMSLDGRIEIVSSDLRAIKDDFRRTTSELAQKIEKETGGLSKAIEDHGVRLLEKVESLFQSKFIWIVSIIICAMPVLYGALSFLQETSIGSKSISVISILVGMVIILIAIILTTRSRKGDKG